MSAFPQHGSWRCCFRHAVRYVALAALGLCALLACSVSCQPVATLTPVKPPESGCDGNCSLCSFDLVTCIVCAYGAGSDGAGGCKPCADGNCSSCSTDYSTCDACNYGFGAGPDGCALCEVDNCADCAADHATCSTCPGNFGSDGSGSCLACADASCSDCSADYAVCTECYTGFGINSTGHCSPCADPQGNGMCLSCGPDGACTSCVAGYGLAKKGKGGCKPCVDSECFNCTASYKSCTSCFAYAGPNEQGRCETCLYDNCMACAEDNTVCSSCYSGEGLVANGTCGMCEADGCMDCSADAAVCTDCGTFSEVNGTACQACELKEVCSNLLYANPYEGPALTFVADLCAPADAAALSFKLLPNGTACGYCGPEASTPRAVDDLFYQAATDVLAAFLAQPTNGSSGGAGAALCPDRMPPAALNITVALGYCGSVYQKSGFGNSTLDIRFVADLDCGAAPPVAADSVRPSPGDAVKSVSLRGLWNRVDNSYNPNNSSIAMVIFVEELSF